MHDYAVEALKEQGAIVTPIDIDALNLPLYNPNDEETSFPESAKTFKSQLVDCGTYKVFRQLCLEGCSWAGFAFS